MELFVLLANTEVMFTQLSRLLFQAMQQTQFVLRVRI